MEGETVAPLFANICTLFYCSYFSLSLSLSSSTLSPFFPFSFFLSLPSPHSSPRSDIGDLQILHNGSLLMNFSASDTGRLDIMEASLSDAGLYECRIVFADGEVAGPMRIGFLTVVGRLGREGWKAIVHSSLGLWMG